MYACQECRRKFRTVKAAQRASNSGCPGCGGVDIDLDVDLKPESWCRACNTIPAKWGTCYCGATMGERGS